MQRFQVWSQEPSIYEGSRKMDEVVLTVTVEDVLWTLYILGIELTDENLGRAIECINSPYMVENAIDESWEREEE